MAIVRADVYGSPNIGIYCHSNEVTAILPPGLPKRKIDRFRKCLGVQLCVSNIGGSALAGIMVAGNSNGIVLPSITHDHELKAIRESLGTRVCVVRERWTALGNVILANDNGAVIHPSTPESLAKIVAETLDVEVVSSSIAGLPYVGSLAVATDKGVLAHPSITDHEKAIIQDALKVPVETGTINGGVPYMRSGLLANSKGAVVGSLTVGPELMALTRSLGIE